jgi:hypothetical protein
MMHVGTKARKTHHVRKNKIDFWVFGANTKNNNNIVFV